MAFPILCIVAYQVLCGLEEGCDNRLAYFITRRWYHSQTWYHLWRTGQGVAVVAGMLAFPGFTWHNAAALLCAWIGADGLYNRVLWFVAAGSWKFDSYDGSWWGLIHRWPWMDWVRALAGIVGAVVIILKGGIHGY